MKRVMFATSLLLVGAGLSACGGGGAGTDAPADASTDEFCGAYVGIADFAMDMGGDSEPQAIVDSMKKWLDDMAKVGTPKDISDTSREGFEALVNASDDLKAEDFEDGLTATAGPKVSEDDAEAAAEFSTWATETCTEQLTEAMTPAS